MRSPFGVAVLAQSVLPLGSEISPVGVCRVFHSNKGSPAMSNPISRRRQAAYQRQMGRCIYFGVLMCPSDLSHFARSFRLPAGVARDLVCTAEHLVAQMDGGRHTPDNIAAACLRCNRMRHRMKPALPPDKYRLHVRQQVARRCWHRAKVYTQGLLCPL